jgi:hypothetical protein
MRKITAGLFIALDGVVEAPDQWHFPYFNDEIGAAVDVIPAARTPARPRSSATSARSSCRTRSSSRGVRSCNDASLQT